MFGSSRAQIHARRLSMMAERGIPVSPVKCPDSSWTLGQGPFRIRSLAGHYSLFRGNPTSRSFAQSCCQCPQIKPNHFLGAEILVDLPLPDPVKKFSGFWGQRSFLTVSIQGQSNSATKHYTYIEGAVHYYPFIYAKTSQVFSSILVCAPNSCVQFYFSSYVPRTNLFDCSWSWVVFDERYISTYTVRQLPLTFI